MKQWPIFTLALTLSMSTTALSETTTTPPDSLAHTRKVFLEAEHALQSKNLVLYQKLKLQLKDYPLFPYLLYEEKRRNMAQVDLAGLRDFESTYADSPVSTQLRDQWLSYHFERKHWILIRDAYRENSPLSHQCQYAWANYTLHPNPAHLNTLAAHLWTEELTMPKSCLPVLQVWQKKHRPLPEHTWTRFQKLLSTQAYAEAHRLITVLPKAQQGFARYWLESRQSHAIVLPFRHEHEVPALTIAMKTDLWCHWANLFPLKTAAMWEKYERSELPESNQQTIAQALGLYLALHGNPEAEYWIEQVPITLRSDALREWHVRLAISQSHWPQILERIQNLLPKQQQQGDWIYWSARAQEAIGHPREAKKQYQQLANTYSYAGLLARHRLKLETIFPENSLDADMQSAHVEAIIQLSAVQRVIELFALNRTLEARREWFKLMERLSPDQQATAAALATKKSWYSLALHSLRPLNEHIAPELRYPTAHLPLIKEVAEKNKVSPAWILAIILKESQFSSDIKSPAGAMGLMQLMPTTAQSVANELDIQFSSPLALVNEDLNIHLGTYYFKELLEKHNNNPVYAVAAYNAGSSFVQQWEQHSYDSMEQWIETIPFQETRNYVKKVINHYAMYQSIMGNKTATKSLFR